jgi:hypothetical protein
MTEEALQVVTHLVPKVKNMPRELEIAARLLEQYPGAFTLWAEDSGFRVNSLAYFETPSGASYLSEQMLRGF